MDSHVPLSARVPETPAPTLPTSPEGIDWRPITAADFDDVFTLVRQMEVVDHPNFVTPREELEEQLGRSYVSLDLDSLLARDATGRAVAFGLSVLSPSQDTLVRTFLDGGVRPDARGLGIGRQVLAWQVKRGVQQFSTSDSLLPGWLMVWTDERANATVRLAERFDFRIARYFLELRRDLADPIIPRPLDGFEVVNFDRSMTESVRLARNDSFRDHWGSQPTVQEDWISFIDSEVFRPDLSIVALAPNGDIAGFVLSVVNEEDFPGQGFSSAYLDLVGVPRAYRRRGVAPALLTRTLQAVAEAGLDKAVLDVDSDNPSGALGLYTGVGFAESHRSLQLNREF